MDELKAHSQSPDFSSLTEIMERFYTVPYDQFQEELNNWFYRNLGNEHDANDLQLSERSRIGKLPALVSEIFHRAELLNALSEAKIKAGNEDK